MDHQFYTTQGRVYNLLKQRRVHFFLFETMHDHVFITRGGKYSNSRAYTPLDVHVSGNQA